MRDWFARMYGLYSLWKNRNTIERECAELGITRLVCGEDALHVGLGNSEAGGENSKTLRSEVREKLEDAFRDPVKSELSRFDRLSMPWKMKKAWNVFGE